MLMLIHILQNHLSLETIHLRFLESGHSFLPNDSEFGDVECLIKENEKVYTLENYIEIMQECRTVNQFQVNRMLPQDLVSVQDLVDFTTNRKKDLEKQKVSWLDTHEIIIEKSQPLNIKMKKSINAEVQTINIEKKGNDKKKFKKIKLKQLYPGGRPLSQEKIKDLKSVLSLVDEEHLYFYDFLNNVKGKAFEDDIDILKFFFKIPKNTLLPPTI